MRLAVAGSPVTHSLSPAMHRAALASLGEPHTYVAREVALSALPSFFAELRGGAWLGANLTHPLKEAALPLLDELSPEAEIGAVNTVVARHGRLVGHNTDGAGFLDGLAASGALQASTRAVALLGAGGAAIAVAHAVAGAGGRIDVVARREEQARLLLSGCPAGARGIVAPWRDHPATRRSLAGAQLLVDCTPLGTAALPGSSGWSAAQRAYRQLPLQLLSRDAVVYDLTYRPRRTALLALVAAEVGITLDGFEMLVAQAARSLELWTGRQPDRDCMRAAALRALRAPQGRQ